MCLSQPQKVLFYLFNILMEYEGVIYLDTDKNKKSDVAVLCGLKGLEEEEVVVDLRVLVFSVFLFH